MPSVTTTGWTVTLALLLGAIAGPAAAEEAANPRFVLLEMNSGPVQATGRFQVTPAADNARNGAQDSAARHSTRFALLATGQTKGSGSCGLPDALFANGFED